MNAILHTDNDRRWSYVTAASLILMAWLALAVWSISPYSEWLDHARMEEIAAPPAIRLAIFTLGWTLMIVAMMLPGTLLLLARCVENAPLSAHRIAPVLLVYLAIWAAFGSFSYWGDTLLHEVVEQTPVLAGVIAPGVLLLAGVYQWTPMKRACLSRCRPDGTVFRALGQASHGALWTIGLRHGLYCLGSCWALMLLMFATGGVNLIWMLILGAIMTVERLYQRGEDVAQPVGVALIMVSILLVIM